MAIQKFNIEGYKKKRLQEFKATPLAKKIEKNALRNALRNKNIKLVPISKNIPKYYLAKIKQIEKYAKTENFWKVFIAFQEIPGIHKTRATPNLSPSDYSNIFKSTVLVVQAFLKKTIYTKGYGDFKRQGRNKPNLPENFNKLNIDYSCAGLLNYISRFEKVRNDTDYFPKSKTYVEKIDLATFIFGNLSSYGTAMPVLLTHCLKEPKAIYQDPNEAITKVLKKIYGKYIPIEREFNNKENEGLSKLALRITNFAELNEVEPSKFIEKFFKSLNGWTTFNTFYLFTSNMFDRFTDYLKEKGHTLKAEREVKIEKGEKPIEEITPRKRRKLLLEKKRKEKQVLRKKINKPMKIKRG